MNATESAGSVDQPAWNAEASVVVLAVAAVIMEMMNAVLCPGLLLRQQSPGVPRNCPFVTVQTDDKAFAF